MNWIDQAVGEFLANVGFLGLSLDHDGFVRLRIGGGGAIEMQHLRDEDPASLMLAWSEPDPYDLPRHLKAAWRMADFRQATPLPLLAAAHEDQLVLATRLDERNVSRTALEESMEWLQKLHEQIRNS
jgi:type III secretion system chaperone SycN